MFALIALLEFYVSYFPESTNSITLSVLSSLPLSVTNISSMTDNYPITNTNPTTKYKFISSTGGKPLKYINISDVQYDEILNTTDIDYYQSFYGFSLKNYDKSNNQNNNICNLPNLIFVHYHKTHGYQKYWSRYIEYECVIYGGSNPVGITINVTIPGTNFTQNIKKLNKTVVNDLSISKLIMLHGQFSSALKKVISNFNQNKKRYLIMVMEREPLQVILSGYNYHAAGNEKMWTDRFPVKNRVKKQFIDIFDKNKYLINMDNTTMYKEYYKGYKNNYQNKTALKYGLYLEFTRFVNDQYYKHISNYIYLKKNEHNLPFIIARFEWFHNYNYVKSIIYILNEMGYNGKTNLFSGLLSGDLSTSIAKKIKNSKHVTTGKYDKELQTDLLLNNENVCNFIKNMTISLDYKWRYGRYC